MASRFTTAHVMAVALAAALPLLALAQQPKPTVDTSRGLTISKAAHLRAVLSLLRNGAGSLANLRAQFAQVGTVDIETEQARDSVLADLVSLERTEQSPSGQSFSAWRKTTTDDYQQWLARVVLPKPRQ
jgi:hypothetical protein